MKKNKMKKTVWGASVAVALTTSTALGVSAYQSGIDFQPSETEESFRANQVRFEDNEDAKGRDNTTEQNKSEFLEKDNNAENENRPQNQNDADYLFEREQLQQNFSDSIALNDNTADASAIGSAANGANTVYDVTDDRSQADVIINGNTGDADNSGEQSGTDTPSEPTQPTDPTQPTEPTEPQPSKPSEGDNGGGTTPDKTPTDTEPTPGYGDASIDPDTSKTEPSWFFDKSEYPTGDAGGELTITSVIIQQAESGSLDGNIGLYKGQKNVTVLTIFNALETYALDNAWNCYYWTQKHLDEFIRIDAVWIDGVEYRFDTIESIDIPNDVETIKIQASYRLSKADEWTTYHPANAPDDLVSYNLKDTRLLILKQALTSEGQKIDSKMVLNFAKDANPNIDDTLDLYSYQSAYLGTERLTSLFPGWKENGKLADWHYTVTAGRHVLEPAVRVPLSREYEVYVKNRWVDTQSNRFSRETVQSSQKLTYMQTLTGYTGGNVDTLVVPKYVQAVDMAKGNALTFVNYLQLPDTVRYVNTDMDYMKVQKGYLVDADNPTYAATRSGILTDSSGTEYLGIPYEMTKLTIPEGITKVTLPKNTQVHQITVETENAENLPEIDYGGMTTGVVIVSDAVREAFISNNGMALSGKDIAVRTESQLIKSDAILSADGTVLRNVFTIRSIYTVPDTVTEIAENAFVAAQNVTTIVLPNQQVTLADGCLADSRIDTILCRTQAQADAINRQLSEQEIGSIKTLVLQTSKEGASYYLDGNETILLLAEEGITEFDGVETAQNGAKVEITKIAEAAFENSKNLKWAMLPEKVTEIGERAFYGCTALEGVMIETKDTITIGNLAFDGCSNLYFIASNAVNGNMGDYSIDLTHRGGNDAIITKLIVTNEVKTGYTDQWTSFVGYPTLAVIDVGSTKMLYGLNEENQPTLAIRSGKTAEGKISLPAETVELWEQVMLGTEGSFTLNWEDLSNLQYIDDYAFAYTDLEGSVTTNATAFDNYSFGGTNITDLTCKKKAGEVGMGAFSECKKLTFVNWEDGFDWGGTLFANLFYGCDKLTRVEINGFNPPQLSLDSPGNPFCFNSEWTEEEEREYIVFPEELAQSEMAMTDFIKAWRYPMLGYVQRADSSLYEDLWQDVLFREVTWTYEDIYEEADAIVKDKLLAVENRIRRMLGAKEATEPTEFYPYRNNFGYLTLIGAPSDIVGVCLNADTIGLPEGWCLDYVGTGAFSNCKNLKSVMFDNGFAGIEYDAFAGVESDKLVLSFMDVHPPELLLNEYGEAGTPFTFGIDINKLQINIFTGGDNSIFIDYIEKWAYPLAGYKDYADMYAAYAEKMGADATKEKIHAAMTAVLLPIENQLRSIILYYDSDFLLVTLPSVNELSFTLGVPEQTEPEKPAVPEEEKKDTPEGGSEEDTQNGTDDANKENDKNQAGDSTGGSSGDNTDEAEPTDPAQEPVTLPDLSEERPVIVEIEIPAVPEETEDAPKEEQNEMPKNGEEESTSPREGEEGGTE